MKEVNIKKIFYLRMGDQLPEYYFELCRYFKDNGIMLIPVSLSEFNEINKKEEKPHLIAVESSFTQKIELRRLMDVGLALSIKSKKIHFYHISSFSPLNSMLALKYSRIYNFFNLPMQIKDIAASIAKIYIEQVDDESRWPGGTRAKLPNVQKISA